MGGVVYKLIWQEEKKDGSTLGIVGQGLGSNVEKVRYKKVSDLCSLPKPLVSCQKE
jgi:hypothetical protein